MGASLSSGWRAAKCVHFARIALRALFAFVFKSSDESPCTMHANKWRNTSPDKMRKRKNGRITSMDSVRSTYSHTKYQTVVSQWCCFSNDIRIRIWRHRILNNMLISLQLLRTCEAALTTANLFSILFLLYSVQVYSIPFYSILFYSILFCSVLFHSILFYSILFYSILFYSILFYSILFYSILF